LNPFGRELAAGGGGAAGGEGGQVHKWGMNLNRLELTPFRHELTLLCVCELPAGGGGSAGGEGGQGAAHSDGGSKC
jgi:hypothetical protein